MRTKRTPLEEASMSAESLAAPTARAVPGGAVRSRERAVLAVSALSVWTHTADEVRIGEYIALPAAALTGALLLGWARMRPLSRGLAATLLGLVWLLGAIPYHVVPLVQGAVVWQNVSGLLQLAGGVPILWLGLRNLRRQEPPDADRGA